MSKFRFKFLALFLIAASLSIGSYTAFSVDEGGPEGQYPLITQLFNKMMYGNEGVEADGYQGMAALIGNLEDGAVPYSAVQICSDPSNEATCNTWQAISDGDDTTVPVSLAGIRRYTRLDNDEIAENNFICRGTEVGWGINRITETGDVECVEPQYCTVMNPGESCDPGMNSVQTFDGAGVVNSNLCCSFGNWTLTPPPPCIGADCNPVTGCEGPDCCIGTQCDPGGDTCSGPDCCIGDGCDTDGVCTGFNCCVGLACNPPPPPPDKYSCSNGTCSVDPNGPFTSMLACQANCAAAPPPPPPPTAPTVTCRLLTMPMGSPGNSPTKTCDQYCAEFGETCVRIGTNPNCDNSMHWGLSTGAGTYWTTNQHEFDHLCGEIFHNCSVPIMNVAAVCGAEQENAMWTKCGCQSN